MLCWILTLSRLFGFPLILGSEVNVLTCFCFVLYSFVCCWYAIILTVANNWSTCNSLRRLIKSCDLNASFGGIALITCGKQSAGGLLKWSRPLARTHPLLQNYTTNITVVWLTPCYHYQLSLHSTHYASAFALFPPFRWAVKLILLPMNGEALNSLLVSVFVALIIALG